VPKHEANWGEELRRDCGKSDEGRDGERAWSVSFGTRHQHPDSVCHARRDVRARAMTGMDVDIVPMVEANGNEPISPLSVAAEPHCVSVKELQLGRRSSR
jgi:hypothetical protein